MQKNQIKLVIIHCVEEDATAAYVSKVEALFAKKENFDLSTLNVCQCTKELIDVFENCPITVSVELIVDSSCNRQPGQIAEVERKISNLQSLINLRRYNVNSKQSLSYIKGKILDRYNQEQSPPKKSGGCKKRTKRAPAVVFINYKKQRAA